MDRTRCRIRWSYSEEVIFMTHILCAARHVICAAYQRGRLGAMRVYLLVAVGALFVACSPNNDGSDRTVEIDRISAFIPREFLVPIPPVEKRRLLETYAYDVGALEYFAVPGRLDLYRFDVRVLETEGGQITVTPLDDPSVELWSWGVDRSGQFSGGYAIWNGRLSSVEISMGLGVRSIDTEGNIRMPDPNRTITRAAYDRNTYTVIEESVRRLDERIVHFLSPTFLTNSATKVSYALAPLGRESQMEFDTVVVYEIDAEKTIVLGDGFQNPEDAAFQEGLRKQMAYKAYLKQLRSDLGIVETPEQTP